uniref:Carboxylic ester hydrolase n=1 Tax=Macrostomum lignano TaxID=282301 RepID=A0A1I8IJM9_9PLAT
AFGGDNSQITLFGESAGAVSVSYHLLSPYTQGYFRRAILNSGSAIAWWASEDRWAASRRSLTLAKLVKCGPDNDSTDVNKIIDCMRQVTPETLQQLTWSAMSNEIRERRIQYAQYYQQNLHRNQEPANEVANVETMLYFDLPFKPVYPSDFIPKMPFMQLRDSVKNQDVKRADLLLGVVKNEGVFWIMYALYKIFLIRNREWNIPFWWGQPMDPRLSKEYEYYSKFSKELDMDTDPHNLVARYFITNINMDGLISEGTSFEYQVPSKLFGKTSWTAKETLDALDAMTSDKSFKCPTIEFAEKYALMLGRNAAHSIWMYSFEQRSELLPLPDWTGVLHGYELDYVFGSPFNERFTGKYYNYTETERQFSDDLMKFWTNFAKTGMSDSSAPDGPGAWPEYDAINRKHIVLKARSPTSRGFQIGENLRKRQCNFWRYQVQNLRNYTNPKPNCSSGVGTRRAQTVGPTKSATSKHSRFRGVFLVLVGAFELLRFLHL